MRHLAVTISKENATDKIEMWSIETGKLEKTFGSGMSSLSAISFSKDGKILKVGTA